MHYLAPSLIIVLGATVLAIKMIPRDLSEKLWKCVGIGVVSGAIGYGLMVLAFGAKELR